MAPARTRRRDPRLLSAGHDRPPPRAGGTAEQTVLPALAVLAWHQPGDALSPGRLRHGRAGAGAAAARRRVRPVRSAAAPGSEGAPLDTQLRVAQPQARRADGLRVRALAVLLRRHRPAALGGSSP